MSVPVCSMDGDNKQQTRQPGTLQLEQLAVGARLQCFFKYHWAGITIWVAPLALMPMLFAQPILAYRCGYVLGLMSVYWITEALPLYVTSLLPIVLLPLFGILDSESVCQAYFSSSLVLFFGSLIVALAIEFSNLHKRVALFVILHVGCTPSKLHFSLLMVTMFTSMWISNTAATTMMCPILKAVLSELSNENILQHVDDTTPTTEPTPVAGKPSKVVISYYLGVAYAASIGGCTTLLGTGTNISFKGIYEARFPHIEELTFMNFTLYSLPAMLLCMLLVFIWLQWLHFGLFQPASQEAKQLQMCEEHEKIVRNVLTKRQAELGPISCHELQVALLFVLMILSFLTRKPGWFPGWAELLTHTSIKNSLPAVLIVLLLFILPVNYNFIRVLIKPGVAIAQLRETPSLLNWNYVNANNNWGLLLLTGGGLALAEGIAASGLARLLGNALQIMLESVPAAVLQLIFIIVGVCLTTLASNIAMCHILMPILLEIAMAIHVHPLYLALPTCLAFSMSFLLPISTPPNAIVAAWADIGSKDMLVAGIGPCLIGIAAIFAASQSWAFLAFPALAGYTEDTA